MILNGVHKNDAWSSAPQLNNVTVVFAHETLSSSGYPMITYTHPVACYLPIPPDSPCILGK